MHTYNLNESGRPREECGIFAIYGHEDAARLTFFGLFALQHRGQESAGIVTSDGCNVSEHKGMGLASEVFKEATLQKLPGKLAIGHVRYSTTGSSTLSNAQPFLVHFAMNITRWDIMEIFSTRRNCVKNWKTAVLFFNQQWIAK